MRLFTVKNPSSMVINLRFQLEFSAYVGLLALKAKFNTGEILYRGRLAL
jgi:hypothetical protein